MKAFPSGKPFTPSGSIDDIQWGLSSKLARMVMKLAVRYYLRFSDDNTDILPPPEKGRKYLLYLHIPFCTNLCPYCSFHRFEMHQETAVRYFELLRQEMRMAAKLGYNFDSVYFGGGTTTILPQELAKTIDLAHELFDIKEVSCETDPDHVNEDNLEFTKDRIDRLSIGLQTFNDKHLEHIGRLEKFGSGSELYGKVSELIKHFDIINLDFIYNFPGQTEAELKSDIIKAKALSPQQITFYTLMFAPFAGKSLKEKLGKQGYEEEAKLFRLIAEKMIPEYMQRTSWTYGLNSTEMIDEYVVDNSEYLGLGSGAFSFLNGKLYANSFSLKRYSEMVSAGRSSVEKSVQFSNYSISQYRMMVEMFALNGQPENRPFAEYSSLKLMGAVSKGELTYKGMFLMSVMMKCFYNGMDYIRESMRSELKPEDERIIF